MLNVIRLYIVFNILFTLVATEEDSVKIKKKKYPKKELLHQTDHTIYHQISTLTIFKK